MTDSSIVTAAEHYDRHLAAVYLWAMGGYESGLPQASVMLDRLGIGTSQSALAVDLGSGPGFYTIPLLERGYRVVAIDSSAHLLGELEEHATAGELRVLEADLLDFRAHIPEPVDLALCMGDTLTHLPSFDAVARLLGEIALALAPDGRAVFSYRDNATSELAGPARFIPGRSDANTIFTCFLEFRGEKLLVHDLLHRRDDAGWSFSVSAYEKLRIAPAWLREQIVHAGLALDAEQDYAGFVTVTARKAT
jgi:SAM-dependent methyltransferase